MKHLFEVGDQVRIKDWETMEKDYGLNIDGSINVPFHFVSGMRRYCDKVYNINIIRVANNGKIMLYELYNPNCAHRKIFESFSEEMFVKVTDYKILIEPFTYSKFDKALL